MLDCVGLDSFGFWLVFRDCCGGRLRRGQAGRVKVWYRHAFAAKTGASFFNFTIKRSTGKVDEVG